MESNSLQTKKETAYILKHGALSKIYIVYKIKHILLIFLLNNFLFCHAFCCLVLKNVS